MPLYDFKCEDCSTKFEKFASMFKADRVECPKCGSTRVTKLFSLFSSPPGSCKGYTRPGPVKFG